MTKTSHGQGRWWGRWATVALCTSSFAHAETTRVGLAPDLETLARAETMTATARGGIALLYNPAGVARWTVNAKLVEYYTLVDQETQDISKKAEKRASEGLPPDLGEAYALLGSGKALSFETGVGLLSLQVPVAATHGFAYGRATVQRVTDAESVERYEMETLLHGGAAAGLAFSIGPWSLGWSRYYLVRSRLLLNPSVVEAEDMAARIDAGTLAPEDIEHQRFARLELGNALGNNFGLLWQPIEDNPTGLGAAVLNAGGTRFVRRPLVEGERAQKADAAITKFADENGIAIENPEPLKEMINVGATVGYGGELGDLLIATLGVDHHDVGGATIPEANRTTAAAELGFHFPDKLAMLTAYKFKLASSKYTYHVGFLGAKGVVGVREAEESAYSFQYAFHAGMEGISPLKLTVQHYVRESMAGVNRRRGYGLDLSFTLIL